MANILGHLLALPSPEPMAITCHRYHSATAAPSLLPGYRCQVVTSLSLALRCRAAAAISWLSWLSLRYAIASPWLTPGYRQPAAAPLSLGYSLAIASASPALVRGRKYFCSATANRFSLASRTPIAMKFWLQLRFDILDHSKQLLSPFKL